MGHIIYDVDILMTNIACHVMNAVRRMEDKVCNALDIVCVFQMEMLSQKQNGTAGAGAGEGDGGTEEQEQEKKEHTATIKGLWKKAFKSLKSSGDQKWSVSTFVKHRVRMSVLRLCHCRSVCLLGGLAGWLVGWLAGWLGVVSLRVCL